ncbi:hypothetical protein AAZX31_13G021200 [Glycine max]
MYIVRYRLEVMVNYKEESTKILLWDRECTELIGQSTNEVNRLEIAEGDVDLNVSSQALDKLLGYVLAFKVKVQPNFDNDVVLRYSNDLYLINVVVDMLPDVEACSKVHLPILDSDDPSQLEPVIDQCKCYAANCVCHSRSRSTSGPSINTNKADDI